MAMRIDQPKKLTPRQRRVFERLSAIVRDRGRADALYNALPESRGGLIINADLARYLVPQFETRDGRILHTPSTAAPAGAYAHDRILRELGARKGHRNDRPRLLMTAGGAGSGKSTSLNSIDAQASLAPNLVFDNQCADLTRTRRILIRAFVQGWEVDVRYVFRSFRRVVRGVIERSERTGRWNRLCELPRSHLRVQSNMFSLAEEFGARTGFSLALVINPDSIIDIGTERPPLSWLAPGSPIRYTSEEELALYAEEEFQLACEEGRISPEVAALVGRPWRAQGA